MKKRKNYTIFIFIFIFMTMLISVFNVIDKKRNETVHRVQSFFFKEENSDYKNSQINQYLKPISVKNIDMDIYSGRSKNEYFIYSKEPGIDEKRTSIVLEEKSSLSGNRVYDPAYDVSEIKYKPYFNYYKVNLNENEVDLIGKSNFDHNKRYKLWASKNYSIKNRIQDLKPINEENVKNDKKLLYAVILYYGFNKVGIQRWKEPSTSSSGWQVEEGNNGKNYVWENGEIKQEDKKLEPNYFVRHNEVVTYNSFIVHSGGESLVEEDNLYDILKYSNKNKKSLERVYSMKDEIIIK